MPALQLVDNIDSTSGALKRALAAGDLFQPTQLIAQTQSASVGRFSRPWISPPGGLWTSIALPLSTDRQNPLDSLRALGLRVGIALVEALRAALPVPHARRLLLKWPNDAVLLDLDARAFKKIAGVLTDLVQNRSDRDLWAVVGVGINANFDAALLPPELHATTTTTRSALNLDLDLESLSRDLALRMTRAVQVERCDSALIDRAMKLLVGLNANASFSLPDGSRIQGRLIRLDPADGSAVIQRPDDSTFTLPPAAVLMGLDSALTSPTSS